MGIGDPEMTAPLLDELVARGIDVRLSTKVDSISTEEPTEASEGVAPCVTLALSDGTTLQADIVVVAVGVRPESDLARAAGLAVGARTGGIVVDTRMRTSDPSIYAVGDAVQVTDLATGLPACIALAGPANRQGRVAADNIVGRGDSVCVTVLPACARLRCGIHYPPHPFIPPPHPFIPPPHPFVHQVVEKEKSILRKKRRAGVSVHLPPPPPFISPTQVRVHAGNRHRPGVRAGVCADRAHGAGGAPRQHGARRCAHALGIARLLLPWLHCPAP
jgi:hypothetical protein